MIEIINIGYYLISVGEISYHQIGLQAAAE